MRSMFGVSTQPPEQPMASARCWSVMRRRRVARFERFQGGRITLQDDGGSSARPMCDDGQGRILLVVTAARLDLSPQRAAVQLPTRQAQATHDGAGTALLGA